jgi:serine/threonine protein kinase/tetratricopeptide (TPR) repeat protein
MSSSLPLGARLGRYEIKSQLGAGGMGEVYLAQDTQLRRKVALKLLPVDFTANKDRLNRFEREAFAASSLNHPNILTIYEIGAENEHHFIATEFIDGKSLRQHAERTGPELREVLDIGIQVASALAAAHAAGVVHRDIKPENIMVRHDGIVKVLDFGLAKLIEQETPAIETSAPTKALHNTAPGVVLGTVSYMSPEQVRGLEVDVRTDIWSFGAVLYEMVAGKRPFEGLTSSDVMAAILTTQPPSLTRFAPKTPSELQRIIKKALRKEREERCQTIKDMLLDLQSLRRELESETEPEPHAQTTGVTSIAILPFRNLTNDETVSFYEFSLADAVITELVRLRSLIVRPSSVVAKYLGQTKDPLEVGRELRVKAVLAASFLYAKKRMRVTAQLIDVVNGEVLWGERIDSDADDIITLQDMMTQRIIDGLQLKLSSNEQGGLARHATNNAAAYEEYLRGRDLLGRYVYHTIANEDIETAIRHFQRALELDPQFALAYCGLGACYINRLMKIAGDSNDLTRAQEAFNKGLSLDSKITEALVYMVRIYLAQGEKQKAYRLIAELRREAPNNADVHFCSGVLYRLAGEYDKALQSWDSFVRLDPAASAVASYNRARIFMYQGRFVDAMLELDQGAATEPDHPIIKIFRGVALFRQGNPVDAANLLREVLTQNPDLGAIRPLLAMCLSAMGEHEGARAQLTDRVKEVAALDHDVPYWLASAYVMEGEYDEAFKWLEKAISLGNENYLWFEANPVWETLRDDPRFRELIRSIKGRHE